MCLKIQIECSSWPDPILNLVQRISDQAYQRGHAKIIDTSKCLRSVAKSFRQTLSAKHPGSSPEGYSLFIETIFAALSDTFFPSAGNMLIEGSEDLISPLMEFDDTVAIRN